MSKKSKRQRRSRPSRPNVAESSSIRAVEISTDYTYIISDLRRTAMIAGLLTAALVALSFFL